MPPRKDRLFDPNQFGPRAARSRVTAPGLYAASAPDEQLRMNKDGAGLVPGIADGLPVRSVAGHSAQKARMVSRDLGTVGRAMRRKWFEVHYLELFSGPGYLWDEALYEEVPGSPIQALTLDKPFDRYVFADYSPDCVEALRTRISRLSSGYPEFPKWTVRQGDANDEEHLYEVCALLDPRALVIAYLDPAKPNLHWNTVELLARRFKYIDFIINLPVSGLHRSLAAGGVEKPAMMLNHPNPLELVNPEPGRTAQNIRAHYDEQLRGLGLIHIARRCVKTDWTNSPLYDVILASRHPAAVKLWERANPAPEAVPQANIFDLLA
jgi:three-Cys-motif partner protein